MTLSATIAVDVTKKSHPISRNLFGKFTEHLGANVYLGAWAQVVANPEFAPADRWMSREALQHDLSRTATNLGLPALATPPAGVAPYWMASGPVEAAVTGADNGRDVQQLRTAAAVRLSTPVHLPLARVRKFELTLKARSASNASVGVSICDPWFHCFARVDVPLSGEWSETKHTLDVPPFVPSMAAQTLLLVIEVPGDAQVELSRVLLFPADGLDGWDPEIVAYMRDAKLPLLRFPGGNFVSGYHWREGVGPLDGRPVQPNCAWGNVIECNHVGTDEWLRLCELVGCEPFICVNAGNGSPEEAREWVDYCNAPADTPMGKLRAANGHAAPYNVRIWEIGNELYGRWQIGYTTAENYARRYLHFLHEMEKSGGNLHFIANGNDPAWNAALVAGAGDEVESISAHFLIGWGTPPEADPAQVFAEYMAYAADFENELERHWKPMAKAGLTPCLAITEQQVFTQKPGLPSNSTQTETLWTAGLTHACIRSGKVEMVTHSALVNHGGGLRKARGVVWANPVWWVTHLYSTQAGTVPVGLKVKCPTYAVEGKYFAKSADVPVLDIVALADEKGKSVNLFVINAHATEAVTATRSSTSGTAIGWPTHRASTPLSRR